MSDPIAVAAPDTDSPRNEFRRWLAEIELYERQASKWETRAKKIVKRYNDERRQADESAVRYDILWSNIQTLIPSLYAKNPKPDFERRFLDADPVARVTSSILERACSYTMDKVDMMSVMRQTVTDRLLPGRGSAWVRYVPHFKPLEVPTEIDPGPGVANEGVEIDDDADANQGPDIKQLASDGQPDTELDYEEVDIDYVHWCDFGHTVARTWKEVRGVWRICYLDRKELIARFGEKGRTVPLDYEPKDLKGSESIEYAKKARVYEIWDKTNKKALWLAKGMDSGFLDEIDDPLGLPDFFPCPRPMFPNLANDSLIPIPDYVHYQGQAKELDDLTGRISLLTRAIKACGVYDGSAPGIARLLSEGIENELIPVDSWAAFGEKGGLKGSMEMLPIADMAQTLLDLYQARDKVKDDLYEITGMADIIRGATDANETATAQQIKSNFASVRLDDQKDDVQRFARDIVRIVASIQAEHFSIETLADMSGVALMTTAEKSVAQQIMALGGSLPDDMQDAFEEPTWDAVDKLLRDDGARCFRLDVETDSTIKMDQQQEKGDRTEFLTAVGQFMQQGMQAAESNPALAPLMGDMLMFAVRAFSVGKSLEAQFQATVDELKKQAKQAEGQPKPNPAMQKAQADAQAKIQIAQQTNQSDLQQNLAEIQARERADAADRQAQSQADAADRQSQMMADNQKAHLDANLEAMKAHNAQVMEQMRMQFEGSLQMALAQLKGSVQIEAAEIAASATLDAAQVSAARAGAN